MIARQGHGRKVARSNGARGWWSGQAVAGL